MIRRNYVVFLLLTVISILLGGVFYCNFLQVSQSVFSEDFDDGDRSDWTVTTTGNGVFGVSNTEYVSSPFSVHMNFPGNSHEY